MKRIVKGDKRHQMLRDDDMARAKTHSLPACCAIIIIAPPLRVASQRALAHNTRAHASTNSPHRSRLLRRPPPATAASSA